MLRDRLFSAVILISVVLTLIGLDHRYPLAGATGLWLLPLLLAFSLATAFEFTRLLAGTSQVADAPAADNGTSRGGWAPALAVVLPATLLVTVSTSIPQLASLCDDSSCRLAIAVQSIPAVGWLVLASIAALFGVLVGEMAKYRGAGDRQTLPRIFAATFVIWYVAVPLALLVLVRQMRDPGWGLAALITVIAVTKSCDAGAYFTGKTLGRHKLIPHLSPGKTWEGAVGGIAASIGVAYLCFGWLIPSLAETPPLAGPAWGPIVFGAVCAVAGMIGDLAESLVKRETGAKDSGRTLPGLGGVWDVTDSLIAAAVPAWGLLAIGLAGA